MQTDKKVFTITYEVRDNSNDDLLDSNIGKQPLEFIMGNGEVLPGLEEALVNAKVGEEHKIVVLPEKGYGERFDDAVQEVSIDEFEGITLERGMTLFGQAENGEHCQVIVRDFNDKTVIIDYNHPLAGRELLFNVQVLGIRDATEMELDYGISTGCGCGGGGHQHGGGGCCGGGGGCCGGHH
ncbi:MAG: peptidylprolyl isomerase [Helicobacter sp.]|nr:peptidylprolyl isomerase [Helicobacter sp.]